MCHHVSFSVERFPTNFTFMWLLSCVNHPVSHEIATLSEIPRAKVALIPFGAVERI